MKPYYEDDSVIIYNGNCLDVIPILKQPIFNVTVTSPPYNMRLRVRDGKYVSRENTKHFSKKYKDFSDDMPMEEYKLFHEKVLFKCLTVSSTVFYNIQLVTGSKEAWFKIMGLFNEKIKDVIIWNKGFGQPAMHDNVLNRSYEMIYVMEMYANKGREFRYSKFDRGTMSDVWRFENKAEQFEGHNAAFPIDLPIKIIDNWSKPNDWILDPFGGTGTTARAAKDLGRKCVMIEISEEYCEIAANRMKQEVFSL
jgi:site-specific DNA-methyltransferase (adenine-specific)/modification methylase